ncbi:uncharacterized protein TNCV_1608601 [Trichonephila clavipes]|nr:uncharacterized protein TNCV_1608601 [Trichonephila clavipes]
MHTITPVRRQYEQMSQFERMKIIGMMDAGRSARQVARQISRSDCNAKKVLEPVNTSDVIYTKTRLRALQTNQPLRRPPHRKKCTSTGNCFIG